MFESHGTVPGALRGSCPCFEVASKGAALSVRVQQNWYDLLLCVLVGITAACAMAVIHELVFARGGTLPAFAFALSVLLITEILRGVIAQQKLHGPYVLYAYDSGVEVCLHAATILGILTRYPKVRASWGEVVIERVSGDSVGLDDMYCFEFLVKERGEPVRVFVDAAGYDELGRGLNSTSFPKPFREPSIE